MYEGNILFVKDGSQVGSMSSKWLCGWPAAVLSRAGYYVDTIVYQEVPTMGRYQKRLVSRADIIIYERHVDDPWLPFLEEWAREKRLFLTLDDAYWYADPSTPTYGFWSKNERLKKLEEVASWSERVIVPSKKLAEHFPNGHYKPNRPDLSDPDFIISPLFSDNSIIWGGTAGHVGGLRDHPVISAISVACEREEAQFAALSGSPDISSLFEDIPKAQVVAAQPYPEWLRVLSGAAIVICPLGEGYDEYRSWIKALETSLAGSVWVGSDRGVYDDMTGGLLAEDMEEAWEAAILSFLKDRGMRNSVMEAGREWAWKQGLVDHLDEWEEIFSAQ